MYTYKLPHKTNRVLAAAVMSLPIDWRLFLASSAVYTQSQLISFIRGFFSEKKYNLNFLTLREKDFVGVVVVVGGMFSRSVWYYMPLPHFSILA